MEYVYTAMLLHSAKQLVNEDNIKKVLNAANIKVDDGRVKALVAALDGVDIDAAIKEAAVPVAASVVVPAASAAPKKEEKKSEESAAAGLGALFG